MPDKNKKYGPGDKSESERPLQNPKVDVEANPRDRRNSRHREVSKRVKKGVTEKVKEAIEKAKDGGAKKQLEAAERAVEDEAQKVSPGPIKKIKVKIDGDVEGPDGRRSRIPTKKIEKDPCG